jgi:hypothetical protein
MGRLFAHDKDVLIEGTDADWARGYDDAAQFILTDWKNWGDLRLDTGKTVVWSHEDVALLTTVGVVTTEKNERPLRFTAVLNRDGAGWRFRQISFQWDERTPESSDVFRLDTYQRLALLAIHRIGQTFDKNR